MVFRILMRINRAIKRKLLIGGDKKSQKADIKLAIDYWKDHQTKGHSNERR